MTFRDMITYRYSGGDADLFCEITYRINEADPSIGTDPSVEVVEVTADGDPISEELFDKLQCRFEDAAWDHMMSLPEEVC